MTKTDLEETLRKMRMNLTQLQGQLSDVIRSVNDIAPADEPQHRCGCGWTGRSTNAYQEHRYRIHNGPIPEHYLAAERAAGLDITPVLSDILDETNADGQARYVADAAVVARAHTPAPEDA